MAPAWGDSIMTNPSSSRELLFSDRLEEEEVLDRVTGRSLEEEGEDVFDGVYEGSLEGEVVLDGETGRRERRRFL